jgi:VWFA-related protein
LVAQFPTVDEYEKRKGEKVSPAAASPAVPPAAPTADGATVFKVETRVVNVTFSAASQDGLPLADLKREEITLLEDGKPQEIRYFSRDVDAPLTIGIIVDLSGSQKGLFRKNKRAAQTFLKQVLRPQDRVFIVTFGEGVRLVQDETSSLKDIQETFNNWDDAFEDSPLWSKRTGSPVYSSMMEAVKRKLSKRTGRKAILMISDGLDTRSRDEPEDVIERLQTDDTIVYWMKTPNMLSQNARGLGGMIVRRSDRKKAKGMERIAEETGGRVFDDESLEEQFKQIEQEMRTLYSVGFAPSREPDFKTHKLTVKVNRGKARVRHKPEYRDM